MSKEMPPEKLSGDQGLGAESPPIVTETNKGKREGLILACLIAGGVVIVAVASIVLLPYVNSLGGKIFGAASSTTDSRNGAVEATTAPAASFKATDATGNVIENGDGLARSEQVTISGYSDNIHSTNMLCTIDTLPMYCDGSPIAISGLPNGKHTFTVMEPSSGETIVRVFSWRNISS
jgi:hypothetical protein